MIHVSYKCSSLGWNPKISPGFFCVGPLISHIAGVFPNDPQLDLGGPAGCVVMYIARRQRKAPKSGRCFSQLQVGKRRSWGIFGAIRSFAYTVDVWNHSCPLVNWHNYRKSPFLMGKLSINGPCSIAFCMFTRGYKLQVTAFQLMEVITMALSIHNPICTQKNILLWKISCYSAVREPRNYGFPPTSYLLILGGFKDVKKWRLEFATRWAVLIKSRMVVLSWANCAGLGKLRNAAMYTYIRIV